MPQSLTNIFIHIIFSTKDRFPLIKQRIEGQLHSYMAGIFKGCDSPAIIIGGTENHVHILCLLSKKYPLSKVIEDVKKSSSKWIKTIDPEYKKFYWQNGYGAFSIGSSGKIATIKYIKNQKEHHRKKTFKEEFLKFLNKYQMKYDERYIWD
ncbi:MAG: transposase [Candidatus Scalindua rubra]|uniref:Transposase n=1 Tax=Candidatus Scalindua rubra TaxID=1872076 RepID=A0A1E3XCP2_9BACT|nr:MAG: transposase [Candidatus Scalindua rubra]